MAFDFAAQEKARIDAIMSAVKEKTGLNLTFEKRLDSFNLKVRDAANRVHVIVCYSGHSHLDIRSVLRQTNRNKGMSWLPGGEAGTNSTERFYWREEEFRIKDPYPYVIPSLRTKIEKIDGGSALTIQ